MGNPKSSRIPKAAQEGLQKKAMKMAATIPNDKDQIDTGPGRRKDDVKNDARSAYGDK